MTREHEEDARWIERARDSYHVPPEPPRDVMWTAISSRIQGRGVDDASGSGVIDIDMARARRPRESAPLRASGRPFGWAVAAAAVLVLGIGIGRVTTPTPAGIVSPTDPGRSGMPTANALATRDYLGQAESLLSMVRVDGRDGRVDAATTEWARVLLAQTRLLIDAGASGDPAVADLLLDLELVLAQIAGAGDAGLGEARERTELDLAIRGLEQGEVLPRIHAVLPLARAGE